MDFVSGVTMEDVKTAISFRGNANEGNCIPENSDIPKLQEQGTLALCKILNERSYAYLADEVGMGKTYQALGVAAMLFQRKPNAKILIITPKENVQDNWCNDFAIFKSNNILFPNNISIEKYNRVSELIDAYLKHDQPNISALRLTSFSTAVHSICKPNSDNKYVLNIFIKKLKSKGYQINKTFDAVNGKESIYPKEAAYYYGYAVNCTIEKFDLVIIDEAQNIRNENNATIFLNSMLGLKRKFNPLDVLNLKLSFKSKAEKILLLSATPAHRVKGDICSQLSYFIDKELKPEQLTHEFLEEFMIRRLRTYGNKTKYECRESNPVDVSKNMSIEQSLYLALIQKKLANMADVSENKSIYKIGFLETFESYNPSPKVNKVDDEGEEEQTKDFDNGHDNTKEVGTVAPDKEVITDLSKSFQKYMNDSDIEYPPHPKLNYMEDELKNNLSGNCYKSITDIPKKALVFVRRIASVNELTMRLKNKYEQSIIDAWSKFLGEKGIIIHNLVDLQEYFEKNYSRQEPKEEYADDLSDDENETYDEINDKTEEVDEANRQSSFFNWIAVKSTRTLKDGRKINSGDFKYTAVSRFKKSLFENNHRQYVFDENYFLTVCKVAGLNVKNVAKFILGGDFLKKLADYVYAYDEIYIKNKDKKSYKVSNLSYLIYYLAMEKLTEKQKCDCNKLMKLYKQYYFIPDKPNMSAGGAFSYKITYSILIQKSIWNILQNDKKGRYSFLNYWNNKYEWNRRELIKTWSSKFLKSSEMILELLYSYIKDNNNYINNYANQFLLNSSNSGAQRIMALIKNYDYVRRMLISAGDYEKLTCRYNPAVLDNQAQIIGAMGGQKNGPKIKRFNTPFYPDVIVCTDVFKEGINLHLFCDKVYHYGLAWSPGDLEQRVGRVDRYFSKTHRKIFTKEDINAKVDVIYPYMGKTIDENQLKKVLRFKIEIDPLMDSKSGVDKEIDINTVDNASVKDLASYEPNIEERTVNPYSGERFWGKKKSE